MPSWDRLNYEKEKEAQSVAVTKPTDENLEAVDLTASTEWQTFIDNDANRNGFIIQNISDHSLFIRDVGSDATGFVLPSKGDSFSPDFKPEKAYEIRADSANSNFVLTVW